MMTLLAIGTLALAVYAAVAGPFYKAAEKRKEELAYVEEATPAIVLLNREKERLYGALKDMEFDYETGKMTEDDYRELKGEYEKKALAILKEIDEELTRR